MKGGTEPFRGRIGLAARILAPAALAVAAGGCDGGTSQARPVPVAPVLAAKAVAKTMPVEIRQIGHVEAIASVAVRCRVGGELTKVWIREGQAVEAEATLFTIDPRPYDAALRQAKAQLAKDQALLRKAEIDIKRYAGLVQDDFITKEQYDLIIANAESLRAAVAADEANVERARLDLEYCTIEAPAAGRTGDIPFKAGNLIKANDERALVTINQTRPIYVSISVPAQHLADIASRKPGSIRVKALAPEGGGAPSEGILTFIDNAVDRGTSTVLLKATFPNEDEALWPGEFVDVTVILGEEPGRIVVPSQAVGTGQQGSYVFVIKEDETAEMRPVKVNRFDAVEAVIDEGLAAGETVITDGQLRVVPGGKVQVKSGLDADPESGR